MTKLIILEGPDECGKTTLAQHLARYFKCAVWHSTASKALFPALPDYHRNIMDNAEANLEIGCSLVLDRFWPSELAYGKLFRPNSGYQEVADALHQRVKQQNYLYIYCFSRNAWGRYSKGHIDPAHSLSFEQYKQVWKNYEEMLNFMRSVGDKTLLYNLEEDGIDPVKHAQFLTIVHEILK